VCRALALDHSLAHHAAPIWLSFPSATLPTGAARGQGGGCPGALGRQMPQAYVARLHACSRCLLARYCSKECQVGATRRRHQYKLFVPSVYQGDSHRAASRRLAARALVSKHKRVCKAAAEKPMRALSTEQAVVREGMLQLQATTGSRRTRCWRTPSWDRHTVASTSTAW
jgi:hypothetical protein